jgi:hypothetical protein
MLLPAGELFRAGLPAQILKQLTLDAAQLIDHLDHVHRDPDGASLISRQ